MKIIFLLSLLLLLLFSKNSNSQISFVGFEQPECLTYSDFGYTYQNIDLCEPHGYGYKIYHYGSQVFYKCDDLESYTIKKLVFSQLNIGFLRELNGANKYYKTNDAGYSWTSIGWGLPQFLGWQMINENTGYSVTAHINQLVLVRVSDIESHTLIVQDDIIRDTILHDTVYGENICDYDTLRFRIRYYTDTLLYQIVLHYIPVEIKEINTNEQFVVFPNPVSDYLEFPSEFFTDDFTVKIYDCNFRLVSEYPNPKSSVYFGNLDSGFYFVEFKDSENRWVRKVIRQ